MATTDPVTNESDGDGDRDTTAYQTYKPLDDPRLHCDKCAACLVYKCGGIVARHYYIHLNEFEYFEQSDEEWQRGLLQDWRNSEHPNRRGGL